MVHPLRGGDGLTPPWKVPAQARPVGWTDLLARDDVTEELRLGSRVGVLAYHAGLEGGTLEVATAVAEATGASLYTVTQPEDLRWHVPSTQVDPAGSERLATLLDHVEVVLTVHGYGGRGPRNHVLLGGRARPLADLLADELARADTPFVGVTDLDAIPADLRGLHGDNPVNRPAGAGVQVELPVRARWSGERLAVAAALAAGVQRWPADWVASYQRWRSEHPGP